MVKAATHIYTQGEGEWSRHDCENSNGGLIDMCVVVLTKPSLYHIIHVEIL